MNKRFSALSVAGFVIGAMALTLLPVASQAVKAAEPSYKEIFRAHLVGAQEVPPVMTLTAANLAMWVREDEGAIRYRLNIKNGQNITAAHLHCGVVGQNGPVVADLFTPLRPINLNGTPVIDMIASTDMLATANVCEPRIETLAHLVQAMREGKIYANVHSTDEPNGLVRGQVTPKGAEDIVTPPVGMGNSDAAGPARVSTPSNATQGAHILLSSYYVMPPSTFTVQGNRFAAGENVRVTALGDMYTVTADQNGAFKTSMITVPLTSAGSSFTVQADGLSSGITETATLKVGTYYPVVTPSAWYVKAGERVSFNGTHFGPSEDVAVTVDGKSNATIRTGTNGSLIQSLVVPNVAGTYTYVFKGLTSKTTYTLQLHVTK